MINSFVTGSEAGIQTIFLAANPVESSVPFTFLCRGTRQSMLHKQQSGFDEFFQLIDLAARTVPRTSKMSFAVRILGVQVRASARSLWRTPVSTASYSTATAALPTTCALSNNYSCSASSSSFSSSSSSFSLPSRSCLHTTQRRWMADDKGTPEAGSRAEAEALFGGPDGRPMGGGGSPGGGRQGAR